MHIFVFDPLLFIFFVAFLGVAVFAEVEHIFVIARQVTVVIRTRVGCLAPFERCRATFAEPQICRGVDLQLVVWSPVVLQLEHRLVI